MLTPDELRKIREQVEVALETADMIWAAHEDCDDSCLLKHITRANKAQAQEALDLIDRELAKE